MKLHPILIIVSIATTLSGCQATRQLSQVEIAARDAALTYETSVQESFAACEIAGGDVHGCRRALLEQHGAPSVPFSSSYEKRNFVNTFFDTLLRVGVASVLKKKSLPCDEINHINNTVFGTHYVVECEGGEKYRLRYGGKWKILQQPKT